MPVIPTFNISRMGIIVEVPDDSLDELVEALEFPSGYGQVMKACDFWTESVLVRV